MKKFEPGVYIALCYSIDQNAPSKPESRLYALNTLADAERYAFAFFLISHAHGRAKLSQ